MTDIRAGELGSKP